VIEISISHCLQQLKQWPLEHLLSRSGQMRDLLSSSGLADRLAASQEVLLLVNRLPIVHL
jgi:hypothetical protein